ncbi:xanthine dehydrogenase family protein molybdopterin-binding subunit [Pararobbsia alpina]|uniref:Aldehyde oxidoreductase molybdenum-binding subunit PaoC n=1 Tax=Pararobbsia alpina TaxID=621374 RepID=A0A6S7BPK9_9BURK|nr:xanthine dehydrogenase family protein molybdopterin-binding subunit [Pararobbsia alpina]CAB3795276.1 Aldehyde oxidoreductase molybdenum-binding subunit PaoC [Pararobbsia alpina]
MNTLISSAEKRIDGHAKVTGLAQYAADFNQPNQAYAVVVGAAVGLGRVTAIDVQPVLELPGIVSVISHLNAPRLAYRPHKGFIDPAAGERLHVLQDDQVRFYGQPVAVVIANTLDDAERGALALRVSYDAQTPVVDPHDPRAIEILPEALGTRQADKSRGNALAAPVAGAVTVDAEYDISRENHTPIELHATVAHWQGEQLTLWSKSQFVVNEQAEIAAIFGLPPENVRVICPFVGGAFGTSLRTWPHVTLAAIAAKLIERPVKLVLSRRQSFHTTGHRPRTVQRISLSATPDGKLLSLVHEGTAETSRYEQHAEALTSATHYMYSCPSLRARYRLLPMDTSTPTHMRGPGEASGVFAIEAALDELAYALKIDPLELRRRNEPQIDEGSGLPFSSRSLLQCYDVGAKHFGWSQRQFAPRSMRDARLLVGWGMASAAYPVFFAPAEACARMLGDGMFEIETASSDMGPGTYTSMTQVAAHVLGVPMDHVKFRLGQSNYPPTPPHGGSMTMASVGSAVYAACQALQAEIASQLTSRPGSALSGMQPGELEWSEGRVRAREQDGPGLAYRDVVPLLGNEPVEVTAVGSRDTSVAQKFTMVAFGAVFVEVAVDPDVLTIQVRRMTGAYGAGHIVNPRLAKSQCTGGMIGGMGMALMESTVLDARDGRPVNAHMADYLVPVNLDIPAMDVHFIDEHDVHVNVLGVKGVGEIALVGVAPAIANAVFHATGKRIRHLPIRLESMLEAS